MTTVHARGFGGTVKCGFAGVTSAIADDLAEVTCKNCLKVIERNRAASLRQPAETRWTALRDQITRDAATEQELGDGYGEMGTDPSWDLAGKHWGRAEALREVLATMDRMEAGQ